MSKLKNYKQFIVYVLSLLFVGQIISISASISQKNKILEQVTDLVKREMILSDIGEIRTKLASFKSFFEVIELKNSDGVLLYTSGSNQASFMKLSREIIPNGSTTALGRMEVQFSVFETTPLTLMLWLAIVIISFPVFIYGSKKRMLSEKMKHELAKLEEKQVFAKKIAHDLRAPLSIVKSSINNPGKIQPAIIDKAFIRIDQIIDGLLDQNTMERSERVNLNTVLSEMREEKAYLLANGVELTLDLVDADVFCEINSVMIKRILSNLIKNAIEATSKGGIKLSLSLLNENTAKISIIDSGSGMSAECLRKVLGDEVYTSKTNGHGIGVKSARDYLQSENHAFNMTSIEGLGTRVDIILTKVEVFKNNPESKIVLVDDDDFIHMMWSCLIKNKDQFVSFKSTDEIISNLSNISIDSKIFIDLNIGQESGLKLAKRLKDQGYDDLYLQTGETTLDIEPLLFKSILSKDFPAHILN
jgi:signal transduction histidine kinase